MAGQRLRIATFNLENLGLDKPGEASPEARLDALRPMLRRLDADVLCLQEINAESTGKGRPRRLAALDALLSGTEYADATVVASGRPDGAGPADVHNLAVVSRLPVRTQRQIHHDLVQPPLYATTTAEPTMPDAPRWDRPIQHVGLELPGGRRLEIVNLHLRAPRAVALAGQKSGPFAWRSSAAWAEGYFMAGIKRAGQALEARLLIEQLFDRDPDASIAVAGDFNAEAREVPVRLLMASEEDTGNGALAGRCLTAVERSLPPSVRFSVIHHGKPTQLDHILVSRALMANYRGSEIHNEALGDELFGYYGIEGAPESFHAPMLANFEI